MTDTDIFINTDADTDMVLADTDMIETDTDISVSAKNIGQPICQSISSFTRLYYVGGSSTRISKQRVQPHRGYLLLPSGGRGSSDCLLCSVRGTNC